MNHRLIQRDLTSGQARLLRLMAKHSLGLEDARTRLGVRGATIARWMADDAFHRELSKLVETAARTRELALQSAAATAAHLLMQAVAGEVNLSASRHRACVELLKLVPAPPLTAPPSPPPAIHPDLDNAEAATLLRQLDRE